MVWYEKIAEKVMRLAYNNNGTATAKVVRKYLSDAEFAMYEDAHSAVSTILYKCGKFNSGSISGGGHSYTLNSEGFNFARGGCFTGIDARVGKAEMLAARSELRANISLFVAVASLILAAIALFK